MATTIVHGVSIQFGNKSTGILGLTGSMQTMDYNSTAQFEEYMDGTGQIVTTALFGQKETADYTFFSGDGSTGSGNATVSSASLGTIGTVTNTSGAGGVLAGTTWQIIGFGLKATSKSPMETTVKLVRHSGISS